MPSFYSQAESLRLSQYNAGLLRTIGLRVYVENPFSKSELDIYWSAPAVTPGHGVRVGFNIFRARSPQPTPSADWVQLNTALITSSLYQDTAVDLTYASIWWYRVEEQYFDSFKQDIERPVNLNSFVNGFGTEPYPDMTVPQIAREWRRRKYIMLNRTAELMAVLVRKVAGTRCTCFNRGYESTEKSMDCPTCYGTGWEGGYEVVKNAMVRVVPVNESLKLQPDGLVLDSNPKFWLVDFPIIRDTDVIVRRNGLRYQAQDMELLTTQGILTEQSGSLIKMESTNVIYSFPVVP